MEQLRLCATTTEPVLQSLGAATAEADAPGARALQQEKPLQWEACALQWVAHTHHTREKS